MKTCQRLSVVLVFLGCAACTRSHSQMQAPQTEPVALQLQVSTPFRFAAYGDSRFHDPRDTEAWSCPVSLKRQRDNLKRIASFPGGCRRD